MNKVPVATPRPTFKRTLRRISMISVVITMTIVWLLLCAASLLTLKQYAQKNLQLLSSTVSHSLEAAVVFRDAQAAHNTLTTLGRQGQFRRAVIFDSQGQELTHWTQDTRANPGMVESTVSHWLYPTPVSQTIYHNGVAVGEMQLTGTDDIITHFVWLSLGVLTTCLLLASFISLSITRYLHHGLVMALQNITDVVHDVRTNRNFSRRVSPERIEEFHTFAQDFNSLLTEMEEWQLQLQRRNDSLMKTAMHDSLTGLANRTAFRHALNRLMRNPQQKSHCALLFMDGDNFKFINDTWGHAAGDLVLIETARRLLVFLGKKGKAYRLGGDEFAMLLTGLQHPGDVQRIMASLKAAMNQPIALSDGHYATMSLSVGHALFSEDATPESLMETADRRMYIEKKRRQTASSDE
ncbi:diguanylate cyclase DgcN [Entomohabitans teleogrylli]|uniref:diguanylate cyclase DgcN n=1 Tax=Entomohabitans teleogrylli TaxID=1384589 RepID=UPI00073DA975|nr:diguanylate cyclase DgcN [Entomohabitans teleogrylli]